MTDKILAVDDNPSAESTGFQCSLMLANPCIFDSSGFALASPIVEVKMKVVQSETTAYITRRFGGTAR